MFRCLASLKSSSLQTFICHTTQVRTPLPAQSQYKSQCLNSWNVGCCDLTATVCKMLTWKWEFPSLEENIHL